MNFFRKQPPIGTPENPEIIEPGQSKQTQAYPRFILIYQIVKIMISVSLPALFFDMIAFWLVDAATKPEGILAWLPLILVAPPAFLFTLLALVANCVLSVFLLLTLMGKTVQMPFARFTRY